MHSHVMDLACGDRLLLPDSCSDYVTLVVVCCESAHTDW